jgi:hypothetical protein
MMKPLSFARVFLLVAALALPLRAATINDDEVAARRVALELAGAFSNDGFKLRDGCWLGKLQPHKPQVIQVNLYAGNQYWFSLGAVGAAKKVSISVHDEAGKPMPFEAYAEESKAAAGFAPQVSGPYYVRIEAPENAPASFCLLYSYK